MKEEVTVENVTNTTVDFAPVILKNEKVEAVSRTAHMVA